MSNFIATDDKKRLQDHGLDTFEALWSLSIPNVDEPNSERGGWSVVGYLTLGDKSYYVKRQSNHLTRSLAHPFGEPTFAREFRNIRHYQQLGIPALTAAFFGTRIQDNEKQAILLTHALDDWKDLDDYIQQWKNLSPNDQQSILKATGLLAQTLHAKKVMHGCFYPKHIFLKPSEQGFEACLIDLEKTRRLHFAKRDRIKDIETLIRRTKGAWAESEYRTLLSAYLDQSEESSEVQNWLGSIVKRNKEKEQRA